MVMVFLFGWLVFEMVSRVAQAGLDKFILLPLTQVLRLQVCATVHGSRLRLLDRLFSLLVNAFVLFGELSTFWSCMEIGRTKDTKLTSPLPLNKVPQVCNCMGF